MSDIVQKEKLAIKKIRNRETFLFKGFTKDRLVKIIKNEKLPYKIKEVENGMLAECLPSEVRFNAKELCL